jgi:replicative DNA helicase Mcm
MRGCLLGRRKCLVDKKRIDEFWRFGEALFEGGLLLADLYNYFTSVEKQSRGDSVTTLSEHQTRQISDERRKAIEKFATNVVDGKFTVYEELPKMIAPYIAGNDELKLALCYSLASTPDKPVHMLMIGNPASVKSDLLGEVKEIFPDAVFGGPRSTEAGLTIDSISGNPGLFMLANNGIALIDEFDKVRRSEINAAYQALESGKISVHTGKLKGDYPTKFVCIAAANPKGGTFHDQPDLIRKQIEDVIPSPLLSRFHIIFLLRKEPREKVEDAVTTILTRKDKLNPNLGFLRDYFAYVKQKCKHVEYEFDRDDPLVKEMSMFVVDALDKSEKGIVCYPLTKRFAEALKRISVSSARLRLSKKVEEVDVRNAMKVLSVALDSACV